MSLLLRYRNEPYHTHRSYSSYANHALLHSSLLIPHRWRASGSPDFFTEASASIPKRSTDDQLVALPVAGIMLRCASLLQILPSVVVPGLLNNTYQIPSLRNRATSLWSLPTPRNIVEGFGHQCSRGDRMALELKRDQTYVGRFFAIVSPRHSFAFVLQRCCQGRVVHVRIIQNSCLFIINKIWNDIPVLF